VSGLSAVTHSVEETRALGRSIGALLVVGDVVLLAGGLGAGKTELTKGIAEALDVKGPVASPTFTLAQRHAGRVPLLHVDIYRLDRVQEVLDLALEEDLDEAVTVVEWGDIAAAYLPRERLEITLDRGATDDDRHVTVSPEGPRWHARAGDLERALRPTA
jgi:tRNA threonylcarbamoyladenosine biosynthesis protein TsaE